MFKGTDGKVWAPSIVLEIGARRLAPIGIHGCTLLESLLARIVLAPKVCHNWRRTRPWHVAPTTTVPKAAKACLIIGAQGHFRLAGMLEHTAGICTHLALATLGHLVRHKLVQKLARIAFAARICQPVSAHDTLVNGTKVSLDILRLGGSFKVKAKFIHSSVSLLHCARSENGVRTNGKGRSASA